MESLNLLMKKNKKMKENFGTILKLGIKKEESD